MRRSSICLTVCALLLSTLVVLGFSPLGVRALASDAEVAAESTIAAPDEEVSAGEGHTGESAEVDAALDDAIDEGPAAEEASADAMPEVDLYADSLSLEELLAREGLSEEQLEGQSGSPEQELEHIESYYSEAEELSDYRCGLIPPDRSVESIHDVEGMAVEGAGESGAGGSASSALPSSYDPRDLANPLTTPAKNQNPFGTCWAFSAVSAMEASLLTTGLAAYQSLDLSERHLAYFTYHEGIDPLDNLTGDHNNPWYWENGGLGLDQSGELLDAYLASGSTLWKHEYALASWAGPVVEDIAPHEDLVNTYNAAAEAWDAGGQGLTAREFLDVTSLDAGVARSNDLYHVSGIRRVPLSDTDEIKQGILAYGACTASVYGPNDGTKTYNAKTHSAYTRANSPNHGVAIVGWDDDYPRERFIPGPPTNGYCAYPDFYTTYRVSDTQPFSASICANTGEWFRYTPSATGIYLFKTGSYGNALPRLELYKRDASRNVLLEGNGCHYASEGYCWIAERLVKGTTYYLRCKTILTDPNTTSCGVTVIRNDNLVNVPTPSYKTEWPVPLLSYELSLGNYSTAYLEKEVQWEGWYEIRPTKSGVYTMSIPWSDGGVSLYGAYALLLMRDAHGRELGLIDSIQGLNSQTSCYLEANTSYYIKWIAQPSQWYTLSLTYKAALPDSMPTNDGAWLMKNSWGTDWGDEGYYWVSYEDACLTRKATATFFILDAADKYDHNYQYDGSSGDYINRVHSGGAIADIYTAKANKGGAERLDAVSFWMKSANTNYSIQVYTGVSTGKPTSGRVALDKPVTGTTGYEGYYTIKLPKGVAISEGERYSVVITLSKADKSDVDYLVNSNQDDFASVVHAGQSFERDTATAAWDDLATAEPDAFGDGRFDEEACCARVKAFTVNIKATSIATATVASIANQTYTGKAIKPAPVVKLGSKTLKAGEDYTVSYTNNVKVGTATVSITGRGVYTGTIKTTFRIVPISLAKATVASIASKTYTGKAIKPAPVVKLGGKTLKAGEDYTVTYTNNVKVGTATVSIKGRGAYTGTITTTFKIVANTQSLAKAKVTVASPQYYTGKALKPSPKVVLGGKTLKAGTDYTVTYADNIKIGTATVTVKGKGTYAGSARATFKIVDRWQRLAGANAVATMQAIVRADGVFTAAKVDTVVVAGRRDFKAALAGTGLAGLHGAPLLITDPNSATLSGPAKAELQRLKPSRVIVVGDAGVVPTSHYTAIQKVVPKAKVSRVAGKTASATAVAIAKAGKSAPTKWGKTCVVATQAAFKDALSIAPYAYRKHAPIFFTESTRMNDGRGLSSETLSAIRSGGYAKVLIVGGELAVPKSVESQLSGIPCQRLAGANAIETSRLIGQFELGQGMSRRHLAVATTWDFADALAGASLAGAQNSIIVLANQTGGYAAFDALCKSSELQHGHILGGPFALSEAGEKHFRKR